MDGALWSGDDGKRAGIWPVVLGAGGMASPMTPVGPPRVRELNSSDLNIQQPLADGGNFSIICREDNVSFTGVDQLRQPLNWAWDMAGGPQQTSAVIQVTRENLTFNKKGVSYQVRLAPEAGSFQQLNNGDIRLRPNAAGKLVLNLDAMKNQ
jgi:hypothetical protein